MEENLRIEKAVLLQKNPNYLLPDESEIIKEYCHHNIQSFMAIREVNEHFFELYKELSQ